MKVNEIFYSLQGEGFFTGTPAVFLRFSGCNLKCSFCDTDHRSGKEMTDREILAAITAFPSRHIVITGGEPSLQLTADFIALLHATGYFIQIETNGTHTLPAGIDWVTCSPKFSEMPAAMADSLPLLHSGIINEIKLVFQSAKQADEDIRHIPALPDQLDDAALRLPGAAQLARAPGKIVVLYVNDEQRLVHTRNLPFVRPCHYTQQTAVCQGNSRPNSSFQPTAGFSATASP